MNNSFWNWAAAAAPVAGLLACIIVAGAAQPPGSGVAGGLGNLFRGALAMAAVCALGECAAVAALVRHERPGWLGAAMAAVNFILMLPGVWVFLRMDGE